MDTIKLFRYNPTKLGQSLTSFLKLVEEKIPEIKEDKPGWDGNSLRVSVDREKSPQLYCTDEAGICITALNELKKIGVIKGLDIKPVDSRAFGTHTAIGIFKSGGKAPIIIIDPWQVETGEFPVVYSTSDGKNVKKSWEEGFTKFSKEEKRLKKEFGDNFKFKDHKMANTRDDYEVFKFFREEGVRSAINSYPFTSFRDRMIYFLDKEGYWDNLEDGKTLKQELSKLSIKDSKTREEVELSWKKLDKHMSAYFKLLYSK